MKGKKTPLVSVVMGSDSDLVVMEEAAKVLEDFGVPCEIFLTSAHRAPQRTTEFATGASGRGIRVIIAGAGAAAYLAGVIASQTPLPVIGVPVDATSLKGLDALLATVQMPGGVPVATTEIGKAGAKNAGLLAVRQGQDTDGQESGCGSASTPSRRTWRGTWRRATRAC